MHNITYSIENEGWNRTISHMDLGELWGCTAVLNQNMYNHLHMTYPSRIIQHCTGSNTYSQVFDCKTRKQQKSITERRRLMVRLRRNRAGIDVQMKLN